MNSHTARTGPGPGWERFPVRFPLDRSAYLPDTAAEGSAERTIAEPAREVPVLAECDVAVLGGGPAGVCAAAAAARLGKRVVLVERHGFLGGMATAANVNIWHSLYGMDRTTKVIGGLPEEIIRRLQRMDAAYNMAADGETAQWVIDSESAKLVFDDLALGSGVRFLFHTWLAGVRREGRRITAAFVESKAGRHAIVADVFVDCTGDADLVRRAGVPTELGDDRGGCQAPTLCFRVGGRKDGSLNGTALQAELFKTPMDYNGERYPTFLWGTKGVRDPGEQMLAATRVLDVNAADTLDLTRAEIEGRYQMRWVLKQLRGQAGWEETYLLDIAAQIGVRESHRIVAEHQLTREELLHGTTFPDVIAQGTYRIDIHNPRGPGIFFEYLDGTTSRVNGDGTKEAGRWDGQPIDAPTRDTLCYQVPYRSLVPRDLDNVLAAGRCIGATHAAAGGIRVMINAMQFGEAAGTAAALLPAGGAARDVEVAAVQRALVAAGAPLRVPRTTAGGEAAGLPERGGQPVAAG